MEKLREEGRRRFKEALSRIYFPVQKIEDEEKENQRATTDPLLTFCERLPSEQRFF